jgi:exopolysaccharide biosynthesis polyprenyl glycosylphosphotransferase
MKSRLDDKDPRKGFGFQRKREAFFAPLLVLTDFLVWLVVDFGITQLTGGYSIILLSTVIVPIVFLMISIALIGGYRYKKDFASLRYASEHLIACAVSYPISAYFFYVVASFGSNATSSRAVFTLSFLVFSLLSLFVRRAFWFGSENWRSLGKFLVIVDKECGPYFYRDYCASGQHQQVRYVAAMKELRGMPIAGEGTPAPVVEVSHLLPYLDRESAAGYEAIVVAADIDKLPEEVADRLGLIHFQDLPVYTMESFYEKYWSRVPTEILGASWPLEADFLLVKHSVYTALKRLLDFLFAMILLLVVSPIMVLIGILIAVFDGFPVLYSQQRAGIHGVPFTLYKFRTMVVGSDQGDVYTRVGDVRVTYLGSVLRKTRLDELPQLWNVLRGDMSMIGPRAEWVKLVSKYDSEIGHYNFRHLVRPGITGWAQVNYSYGESLHDALQKFSYDLYYIRNFSLKLDAEVLLKTIFVVLFGRGR